MHFTWLVWTSLKVDKYDEILPDWSLCLKETEVCSHLPVFVTLGGMHYSDKDI